MKRVTLYTKPGCHLCEAVEEVIRGVQKRRPLELEICNILLDPRDLETYGQHIPIVLVDGVEIARYRLTAAELEAALQAN